MVAFCGCRQEKGQDKFYSFYRYFLLRLFHEGLGGKARNAELDKLLGRIPYLNGGLFEMHPIEERCPKIAIPDEAFTRIFAYFDRYQWHLDERPLRNDNEINPDVLGYIFEKYINQKQMGAYYTKEDITEYISKNTVIPFLFDAAKARCKVAFENPGGPTIWDHLRDDPDRYIYAAVKHGVPPQPRYFLAHDQCRSLVFNSVGFRAMLRSSRGPMAQSAPSCLRTRTRTRRILAHAPATPAAQRARGDSNL